MDRQAPADAEDDEEIRMQLRGKNQKMLANLLNYCSETVGRFPQQELWAAMHDEVFEEYFNDALESFATFAEKLLPGGLNELKEYIRVEETNEQNALGDHVCTTR